MKNEAFICAQTGSTPDYSSESCLTLDIYRPAGADKGEILFWIHGGGFATGASSFYSGVEQAGKYGNTVVVIQYRTESLTVSQTYKDSPGPVYGR